MKYHKVLHKKVISPDGRVRAEATSHVVISGDHQSTSSQSVSVNITQRNSSSSSSSSSTSSSRFHAN